MRMTRSEILKREAEWKATHGKDLKKIERKIQDEILEPLYKEVEKLTKSREPKLMAIIRRAVFGDKINYEIKGD